MKPTNSENAQAETTEQRYADSIEAAAGALGRSDSFLTRVKAMGCPAFRGSRVYLDELEDYIEENRLDDLEKKISESDEVDIAIRKERLRKLQLSNEIEAGKYIRKEEIAVKVLSLGLRLKALLRKKLEEEYPDKLTGRSREEILPITRQLVDEICTHFNEGAQEWSQ